MSNILQTKTAEKILTTVFKPKEFIIDGLLTQGLIMRWVVENDPAPKKSRDNIVLSAVYLFIKQRIHFEGTATELVAELKTVTDEIIYPNRVTRDLIQNGYELSKYGIVVESKRIHKGRIIILRYNAERDSSDGRKVTVTKALTDSSQTSI